MKTNETEWKKNEIYLNNNNNDDNGDRAEQSKKKKTTSNTCYSVRAKNVG